jgi:Uma2 family endonuclease
MAMNQAKPRRPVPMATAELIRKPGTKARFVTLEDVLNHLGGIPPCRVLTNPPPGLATEADLIAHDAGGGPTCELIDGILVRKYVYMGEERQVAFFESRLAMVLGFFIELYLRKTQLGIVVGEGAYLRVFLGQVRAPDLSFISWKRMPNQEIPRDPIAPLVPDLAVEVISKSNTKAEMDRKLREYFQAGCKLAWYVYPKGRTVHVFTSVRKSAILTEADKLDGGKVLPGFSLSIRKWFREADRWPRK